jgi:bifunctional non-homologous end joining protein LigD
LLVFTSDQVLQRVEKLGDLFEPVMKLKQKLPPLAALGQNGPHPAASATKAKVKKIQSAQPAGRTASKSAAKPVKRKARAR